jgi:signal transduction histidine kinase
MPHLFDRFWQARKRDRRGTGLGLTICKAIVEAHGGTIEARNAPGGGAEFRFALPLPATEATAP